MTLTPTRPRSKGWLETARNAYDERNRRLADLTDEAVDEFYSCTLCQSFAPNHVCLVTPERLGLCGAYNWLDRRRLAPDQPDRAEPAHPQGPPARRLRATGRGPTTSCNRRRTSRCRRWPSTPSWRTPADRVWLLRECIAMVIPEANGIMVVSREGSEHDARRHDLLDAGRAGRRRPGTPGIMGVGKFTCSARNSSPWTAASVVWMSSFLSRESAGAELRSGQRTSRPDRERSPTSALPPRSKELLAYLERRVTRR